LSKKLLAFRSQQLRLIEILKESGVTKGLTDKNPKNIVIPLSEIDPFTFVSLIQIEQNGTVLTNDIITVFRTFWLFQHMRTEAAAIRAVQVSESARELLDIQSGQFSLEIKDAVQMACYTFASSIHVINDLKFCLLRNKTDVPFITSDNPAVFTNKWRLDKKRRRY